MGWSHLLKRALQAHKRAEARGAEAGLRGKCKLRDHSFAGEYSFHISRNSVVVAGALRERAFQVPQGLAADASHDLHARVAKGECLVLLTAMHACPGRWPGSQSGLMAPCRCACRRSAVF
jgi:hypothetical protein